MCVCVTVYKCSLEYCLSWIDSLSSIPYPIFRRINHLSRAKTKKNVFFFCSQILYSLRSRFKIYPLFFYVYVIGRGSWMRRMRTDFFSFSKVINIVCVYYNTPKRYSHIQNAKLASVEAIVESKSE